MVFVLSFSFFSVLLNPLYLVNVFDDIAHSSDARINGPNPVE